MNDKGLELIRRRMNRKPLDTSYSRCCKSWNDTPVPTFQHRFARRGQNVSLHIYVSCASCVWPRSSELLAGGDNLNGKDRWNLHFVICTKGNTTIINCRHSSNAKFDFHRLSCATRQWKKPIDHTSFLDRNAPLDEAKGCVDQSGFRVPEVKPQ